MVKGACTCVEPVFRKDKVVDYFNSADGDSLVFNRKWPYIFAHYAKSGMVQKT